MPWLRRHLSMLSRLALLAWVVAFVLATTQGCFAEESVAHDVLTIGMQHDHAASKVDLLCAHHCAQAKSTIASFGSSPLPNPSHWVVLLVLPLLFLPILGNRVISPRLSTRLFAPPDPAARLLFVRFND
ncbi:hypothetical protein [Chitinimonas sp.]|uniref:hypothetical protein n=1 Tax=Chitinimonas sp. TaxID=1934313 RepID=UPI0035B4592C